MAERLDTWTRGGDGDRDRWFYLRRTDPAGKPVILELHLIERDSGTTAQVHVYDEPDDHTGFDLAGCPVRCSGVPARHVYEEWLLNNRSDDVAFANLAELDIPEPLPPLPPHAQRKIDALTTKVAELQRVIDDAGLQVQVQGQGMLLAQAAEHRLRRGGAAGSTSS
jgi:hypothetical protein